MNPNKPPVRAPVQTLLDTLGRNNGWQVNLERNAGRLRLRCRQRDPATGLGRRLSRELPVDPTLQDEVIGLVNSMRRRRPEIARERRERREARAGLVALRKKMLAASKRGRDVKKRIAWMFNRAATMGLDVLEDYLAREPWLARGKPAGRPRRLSGL
ncbi:MAG: hypothetical protein FWG74_07370 [Planctomycetes bacterium]|nr:hypothetical protein [Planctomycetota bacterium]